jgi:hypothetical protein
MDPMTVFLNQVVVLLLMLAGMFIGDSASNSVFGRVKGTLRQLLYLLLFVVFLVLGNYIPSLIGIQIQTILNSILFYGFWGFLSVFLSRLILFSLDRLIHYRRNLKTKKKPQRFVDVIRLVRHLRDRGLNAEEINLILSASTGSGRKAGKRGSKEKTPVDPYRLSSAFQRNGFDVNETADILVKFLKLTPEKAVRIWRDANKPCR